MPAAVLFLLLFLSLLGSTENVALKSLIQKGRHPAIRWGLFSDVQSEARQVYARNGWVPLWLADGRPTREARALLDALVTAGDRGLDPQDYDAAQLTALAATLERRGADDEQAIRFDAALTIGALRFVRALARGRIEWKLSGGVLARPAFDAAAVVDSLRHADSPEPKLQSLEPSWAPYRALKRALARYRRLMKDSASRRGWYADRIRQIELALERWRWLPRELGDSAVLINVPAFRLQIAVGTDPPLLVRMNVRVGSGRCRELPVFAQELRMVVFRPVGAISAVKFPLTGELALTGNVLDRSAQLEENSCVRVADGELLAELLLRGRPEWTRERIRQTMTGNRQVFVRLPRPVPVLFVYGTALADENARASFFPDVLGHDGRLDRILQQGYPYPR